MTLDKCVKTFARIVFGSTEISRNVTMQWPPMGIEILVRNLHCPHCTRKRPSMKAQ